MHKLNLFVTTLAVLASLGSAGCGSKSSGNASPAPAGPVVDQNAYEGEAGKFASLYTGTCVVQAANHTYTSCNTQVRIKQTETSLYIRTQFFVNQSNSNSAKIVGKNEETITLTGKQLFLDQTQVGVIGREGFYYVSRTNQPFHFVRLYPNNYEYQGTFADSAGRPVLVTGRVQRGAKVQGSNGRRTATISK